MEQGNNSVINALKRLERAGSENSRAIKKLHEAAAKAAQAIIDAVPIHMVGEWLPRDYRVVCHRSNVSRAYFLVRETESENYYIDGLGGYLHGDLGTWIPGQKREGSLLFAKDVSDNLLGMIAQHIEESMAKITTAADILENINQKDHA